MICSIIKKAVGSEITSLSVYCPVNRMLIVNANGTYFEMPTYISIQSHELTLASKVSVPQPVGLIMCLKQVTQSHLCPPVL